MKLNIIESSDHFFENHDYRSFINFKLGEIELVFLDGEPEDANLSRDYSDVYKIKDLVMKAYKIGKAGGDLEVIQQELDDFPGEEDQDL